MTTGKSRTETVRVALVMNGGVSLAVWMGGVTHELYRLLEASRDPDTDTTGWAKALRGPDAEGGEIRQRVVVDHAAGTSAGGLNGVILATALAHEAPLPDMKEIWRTKAKLQPNVLLSPADWPGGNNGRSVLDGDFFHHMVSDVLTNIPDQRGSCDGDSATPASPGPQVTLLVTATAMSGSDLPIDSANRRSIDVSDHRRVYRFTTCGDGVGDFDDADNLALAARASASFPVAFAPVRETSALAQCRVGARTSTDAGPIWLIDGGVLDNAPFEPLIHEIVNHPRPDFGRRLIVYVVPSSKGIRPKSDPLSERAEAPPPWLNVLLSLGRLRKEVDLRSDVEALRQQMSAVRDVSHPPEELIALPPPLPSEDVADLLALYAQTRAVGFIHYLRERAQKVEKLSVPPVEVSMRDEVIAARPYFIPRSLEPEDSDGQWQWGVTVARRMALWMSRHLRAVGATNDALADLDKVERELGRINVAIDHEYAKPRYENRTASYVLARSHPRIALLIEPVAGLMSQAIRTWEVAINLQPGTGWSRLASVEVVTGFDEWHQRPAPPAFDTVWVDTGEPSIEKFVLAGNPGLAADLLARPNDKLYGTRIGHFGAFGAEAYRMHDWTWGRIDGALCLAEALTKHMAGPQRDELRHALVAGILAEEGTSLPQFVQQTYDMHQLSNLSLAVDIAKRGEVDVPAVIASIDRAVAAAGGEKVHGWLRKVTVLNEVSTVVSPAVHAVGKFTRWLGERVHDVGELLGTNGSDTQERG